MHLLVFLCLRLSDTEIFMSAVRRRRPYGQVGVGCRLIPGSTVAKLPVGLACHYIFACYK
jgi:hypothetical protein